MMKLFFCMYISMKTGHKSILWFWWVWQSIPKVPKIASLQCLYNISRKKKLEMKLIFGMNISIKGSYKLISTLWASKFPPRQYYHHWWAWSIILKELKVKSLQYLYNISKKKLGVDFIIKGSTSCHYPFW